MFLEFRTLVVELQRGECAGEIHGVRSILRGLGRATRELALTDATEELGHGGRRQRIDLGPIDAADLPLAVAGHQVIVCAEQVAEILKEETAHVLEVFDAAVDVLTMEELVQ